MTVLLDTNIIIHREASRIINEDIGTLFKWIDKLHYTKCIHPLTINELNRHNDPVVVETMQRKLASYQVLQTPAPLHNDVKQVSSTIDTTANDLDDTNLLNEVFYGRVDVLISEDKKVHTKARLLSIDNKVFRIESFLEKILSEHPDFVDYKVLAVKRDYFGNIELGGNFFESFRNDYIGFDKWYNKKAGENERAYVCYEATDLKAFLFLKVEESDENYADINPIFIKKKRLKIGTFKVVSNGLRIGERFLKIVFDNARLYKVDEIYLTIFNSRPELLSLIALLEKYGFIYHGIKTTSSGDEKVFVRDFSVNFNVANPRLTFPWLSKTTDVYITPIKPEYHTELFPDSILKTESPLSFVENQPHRNAISKSYISHSLNRDLQKGDTIVFYRSGGIYIGVTTTIGIIEDVITEIKDANHLIEICRKRTVLSNDELKAYWNRYPYNKPFVINFLYAFSFKKRITLKEMLDKSILPSMETIRTINKVSRDSFTQLIQLSGL